MKTINEVLIETGLSYPQLNQLKGLGIIPKPVRKGLGNRKGVIGVYDDNVIEIIRWVKKQRKKGFSLLEIAEMWRKLKATEQVTGELIVAKPNPDATHWGVDLFTELAEEHPLHAYGQGKIESVEELPNGNLRIQYLLSKKKPKE